MHTCIHFLIIIYIRFELLETYNLHLYCNIEFYENLHYNIVQRSYEHSLKIYSHKQCLRKIYSGNC